MYKIIGADQKEYGPVSPEQLRQWFSEGRVNAATRVQAEGSGVWKPFSEWPEFASLFPAAPAQPPPPPPSHGYVPPPVSLAPAGPVTNKMAVWSMGLGIFSLFCCSPLGVVALVLGIVALSNIKSNPNQGGQGFAIAGIALGALALLVGISVALVVMRSPDFLQNLQNQMNRQ